MPQWTSQEPGTWGWPRGQDVDRVMFTYDDHPFPQGVARLAEPVFRAALDTLTSIGGVRLNESHGLEAGMWGYENRRISPAGPWSFHSYGLALDINAPWNPHGSNVPPPGPYRMPDSTGVLIRPHGLVWGGGAEGFGDPMHIECHLTPGEASVWRPPRLPPAGGYPFPLPAVCYYGPFSGPAESISGSGRNDAVYRPELALAQTRLGVTADGYYGPITAAATRSWQATHGLGVDGLIGPATWRSLMS